MGIKSTVYCPVPVENLILWLHRGHYLEGITAVWYKYYNELT